MVSEYTVRVSRGSPASKAETQHYAESSSQSQLRIHLNIHHETGSGTGRDPEEKEFGVGKWGALDRRRGIDEAEGGREERREGRIGLVHPPA